MLVHSSNTYLLAIFVLTQLLAVKSFIRQFNHGKSTHSIKSSPDFSEPGLQEFLKGGPKEWKGTRIMLERRGEKPNPKYGPLDVVKICLKTLQTNDHPQLDHGACVLIEFKSPKGPLSVFTNPAELGAYYRKEYANLVDFKEAKMIGDFEKVQMPISPDAANSDSDQCNEAVKQTFMIQPWEGGTPEKYDMYLSKWNDLWLVDVIVKR